MNVVSFVKKIEKQYNLFQKDLGLGLGLLLVLGLVLMLAIVLRLVIVLKLMARVRVMVWCYG